MRKFVLLALLFIGITAALFPQVPPDWYMDKPITEITFKGLSNINSSELEGITAQYIGKNFTDDLFLDLQSKLYALDFFEVFTPNALPGDDDYTTLIIEFEVVERPVIDEIKIEGNRSIRRGDILDTILLKRGDMVNKTKVRLDSDAISDLYLERGYPDVAVDGEITRLEDDSSLARVVFKVVEGSQTKIREILFSGNTFASENTLRREMTTKKQGLFSTGVFMESKIEEDIMLIQQYYWDRGYVDARVVEVVKDIQFSEEDQKNFMTITIYIEEGFQYYYGGMRFEGNTLFSSEELGELVRQKEGKVLSITKLEQDFIRVTDVYYDDGYIYNTILRDEERDEDNRTISYVVSFVERGRAHIENIIITGNDKTRDYVLYRELPLEVGDIFSKEKIMEGLQNLYNTGYFSSVAPTTPMGSTEGLMDLIINVEEGKTIDINFGITFTGEAGEFPVLGFLKWEDLNFLGRGQEISIGTEISSVTQNLNFSFTENWLFGRRWSGGLNFSVEHERTRDVQQDILTPIFSVDDPNRVPDPYDGHYVFSQEVDDYGGQAYSAGDAFPGIPTDDEITDYDLLTDYGYSIQNDEIIDPAYLMDYHSYDFSLGGSTGYRWITGLGRVGVGGGLNFTLTRITYDSSLYRPFNSTVRNNLNQWKFVDTLWTNLYWDTRDLIHNPSKGFYLTQKFTFTGGPLGGTRHYIRSSSKAEGYLKLFEVPVSENWSFKGVLAAHSSFTIMLPNLGWPSLKAKYSIDPDEPLYVTTPDDELYIDGMLIARGWDWMQEGEALWNNWIELRFPIAEQYLWWDFFFSSTAMWQDKSSLYNMDIDDFLFSFGGGLRLTIPGLPIGFYLTKRFKTVNHVVEWQTGELFNRNNEPGKGLDLAISFTYELF